MEAFDLVNNNTYAIFGDICNKFNLNKIGNDHRDRYNGILLEYESIVGLDIQYYLFIELLKKRGEKLRWSLINFISGKKMEDDLYNIEEQEIIEFIRPIYIDTEKILKEHLLFKIYIEIKFRETSVNNPIFPRDLHLVIEGNKELFIEYEKEFIEDLDSNNITSIKSGKKRYEFNNDFKIFLTGFLGITNDYYCTYKGNTDVSEIEIPTMYGKYFCKSNGKLKIRKYSVFLQLSVKYCVRHDQNFGLKCVECLLIENINLPKNNKKIRNNRDNNLCGICTVNTKTHCMVPCGHYGYCGKCISKLDKCSYCNMEKESEIKIYNP